MSTTKELRTISNSPLIVIPARRASTRLPDKLLLRDTGKTVIQHTIERALESLRVFGLDESIAPSRLWVACDDAELEKVARTCGIQSVLVTEPCDSGTERIARALPSLPLSSAILNIQADEPEIPVHWIVRCLQASTAVSFDVATIAVPIELGDSALESPSVVKTVLDHESYAMYFSRSLIPHLRAGGIATKPRALRHVGIYLYDRAFVARYLSLPSSDLEQSECLEQLRFLQCGARIKVLVMSAEGVATRGIDTEADYREFVKRHAQPN